MHLLAETASWPLQAFKFEKLVSSWIVWDIGCGNASVEVKS